MGAPTLTTRSDGRAIAAVRQRLEAAENAGDAEALAALLTDDAALMVPDFAVQEGKASCARFVRDVMSGLRDRVDRRIAYTSAEVVVTGDTAYDRGTFAFSVAPKSGGEAARVTGKYLWLLRRTATGSWKIARLIVSRDEPGTPASGEEVVGSAPR